MGWIKGSVPQTYLLLTYVAPEAIIENMLDPLTPYLIRTLSSDVPVGDLEAVVGGRAGLLAGVFYLPLLIMNVLWGTLSDIVGRKPILILGLFFSAITTFLLGINTTSFTLAMVLRFFAGCFGANSTVAKGALGEIHLDETGRSWAYSLYGSLYALAGILGPLIGGLLVKPTVKGSEPPSFPYFIACSFGTLLCVTGLLATHHNFHEPKDLLHAKSESEDNEAKKRADSWQLIMEVVSLKGLAQVWTSIREPMKGRVMFPILLYVLIAFCNRAWSTLFPLYFSAKLDIGGFEFTALDTSVTMTLMACSKLLFQTTICQPIVTRIGMNASYCVGMAAIFPATILASLLSGTGGSGWSYAGILVCMVMLGFVEALVYLAVIMMITDSVPASSLGAAHGLSATCAAFVRTLAPPLVGYVWKFVVVRFKMMWTGFAVVQAVSLAAILIARTAKVGPGYSRLIEEVEMPNIGQQILLNVGS